MKMDEHARAWGHEFVAGLLNAAALPPEQRNSLHWEILSHLHEAAERRVEGRGGHSITLADLQGVVQEMGGRDGIAAAFLQTRVVATPRAGFGKRFGAYVIDAVLAFLAIGLLFGALEFLFVPFGYWGIASPWEFGPVFPITLAYAYFVVMEVRSGATIGKMAFKLRTVSIDGRPLTLRGALIRNVSKVIPPLLLIDTLLYLLAFNKEDQRASDRLADTIVIDTARAAWTPPLAPMPPPAESKTFIPLAGPGDSAPAFQPRAGREKP